MPPILHLPSFGGGVALEGSQDLKRADELRACEEYDIAPRGALVPASALETYATCVDGGGVNAMTALIGAGSVIGPNTGTIPAQRVFVVGQGTYAGVARFGLARADAASVAAPVASVAFAGTSPVDFVQVTILPFSYTSAAGVEMRPVFLCLGARECQTAQVAPGLWVSWIDGVGAEQLDPISKFDALGTGAKGEVLGGTNSKQLFARGAALYNSHAFVWGHDQSASTKEGPARLMFSNPGNPLKFGNDDQGASGADRAFSDSDAIPVGDIGETIRAGLAWRGRLWLGTSRELHYIEGRGRDSFLTDGSRGVRNSANVVGPNALREGPDNLLYGVSSNGLWGYDGGNFLPPWRKLRDAYGHSLGYWDHLWNDPAWGGAAPGPTNADLVWLLPMLDERQVWVVIPFTNAAAGYGAGSDTVVLKYHVDTGGWTRQAFVGLTLLAGCEVPKTGKTMRSVFILAQSGAALRRYGHRDTLTDSPPLPVRAPAMEIEWTPYGPDGVGSDRKVYLTLAWESAASLPITLKLTRAVDGDAGTSADGLDAATNRVTATIGAVAHASPEAGDLWLDTNGTDANLGNAVAGTLVPRTNDFVLKTYRNAAWKPAQGGGQRGTRATIPFTFVAKRGTRVRIRVDQVAAAGRYQLEGLGLRPRPGGEVGG